ncbi:MAG: carbohydrate binding domain-containing protein [Melioribacteraceae bacterium]|nr:carbohydrate binding domain-containing protein [Melioribacteraceae bacterium]
MRKIRTRFLYSIILVVLTILGCTENPIVETESYSVQGIVFSNGIPVEGAIVKIEGINNLKTQTDSEGNFKLLNVPKGNHDLTVTKSKENGSFSERTNTITVESDMTIDNLILPKGVHLSVLQNITDKSAKLLWSTVDETDFREYKIYQHSTSGLDESTGTLIHIATNSNDTTFTADNLNPLTQYFFRVYVMNDYGRLGGSNIVSSTTMNYQIIKNGNFEILKHTGYPENWNSDNFGTLWLVDSAVVQDGTYSLSVHGQAGLIMPWQSINPSELVAGSRYRMNYWVKYEALQSGNEFAIYMDNAEFTWSIQINPVSGAQPESDWKEYSYEFTMPSVSASNFNIRLYSLLSPEKYAWIDNLRLEKVQ